MRLVVFFLMLLPNLLLASLHSEYLNTIRPSEKKDLEIFFRHLVIHEGGGLVLFGDKPMSIGGFRELTNVNFSDEIFDPAAFILHLCSMQNMGVKRGFEIWSKAQSHFPIGNYLIFETKFQFCQTYRSIVILNKAAFRATFNTYKADFQKVLGTDITAQNLIEKFQNEKENFYAVLNDHDGLLGTLLGYGRDNAWLYQRRKEIDDKFWQPQVFSLKKPPDNSVHGREIIALRQKLKFFPEGQNFIPSMNRLGLRLPGFIANFDLPETIEIHRKWHSDFNRIVHLYDEGDFLETTLNQYFSLNEKSSW